jgi:ferredoxin
MISKAVIYFLTGTGNSLRIAAMLADECVKKKMPAALIPIDAASPETDIDSPENTLAAFVFPTHGFMPPWSGIKFLFKMPVKKGCRFLCVPTRGCFHIWKVPIPGVAGLASIIPHLILVFKKFSPAGSISFDMPSNMTSLHPKLTDAGIQRIISRAERKARKYFPAVLAGRGLWFTLNNLWEYLWGAALLILIPAFPVMYLIVGRFFMGKLMFADYRCTACGLCVRSCPNNAVVMKDAGRPRPFWKYSCEACLRCMNICPSSSVQAGHSWAVLLLLISSFPLSVYVFAFLAARFPGLERFDNVYTSEAINFVYFYPAILASYAAFFYLIRYRPVNILFSWTTFTRLYKRYLAPEVKAAEFGKKKIL